jgi:hypothetical protein
VEDGNAVLVDEAARLDLAGRLGLAAEDLVGVVVGRVDAVVLGVARERQLLLEVGERERWEDGRLVDDGLRVDDLVDGDDDVDRLVRVRLALDDTGREGREVASSAKGGLVGAASGKRHEGGRTG